MSRFKTSTNPAAVRANANIHRTNAWNIDAAAGRIALPATVSFVTLSVATWDACSAPGYGDIIVTVNNSTRPTRRFAEFENAIAECDALATAGIQMGNGIAR